MADHVLHVSRGSAPCRSVLLTLGVLRESQDLEVEVRDVDLRAGEHLSPEFLALNPLHTVPTLECVGRGGLRESRAIMRYLCELAVTQSLYPEDPWARAQVDAALDWDLGTFYPAIAARVYPQLFADREPTPEALEKVDGILAKLESLFADQRPCLTGERPCLADLSVACGMSMLEIVSEDDALAKAPRTAAWRERVHSLSPWAAVDAPFQAWRRAVRG